MVLILDGEIVQDNDPRAIARRKGSAAAPQRASVASAPRPAPGGSGAGSGAGGGPGGAGGSPLDALAAGLGLEGQVITIPRLHARIPERHVPVVVAGLVGVATLFFGWRVLAVAAALHVLSGFSETAPAGPGAPGRGAAGGTAGGRAAQ